MNSNPLSVIIFAPLAGAVINWLAGRRLRNEPFIGVVACGSIAISTVIAFYLAFKSNGAPHIGEANDTTPIMDHLWTCLSVGTFRSHFSLAFSPLVATSSLLY